MQEREYYFDNAKFVLIFLVVFGHFLRPYIEENQFVHSIYVWIFLFHMPAFVLISGYFSKNFHKRGYFKKLTKKLLIPYLIFQLLYSLYYTVLYERDGFSIDFLIPHWGLWFLLSLFSWNALLYVFTKIPKKISLGLTILLGILVGFTDLEKFLSLSRTFTFFPFFLAGFLMRKKYFEVLSQPLLRWFSFSILAGVFAAIYYFYPGLPEEWLYGSKSYETLGVTAETGILFKLLLYSVSFVMTFCLMSLIPHTKLTVSAIGTRTFYIYILHGFILKYLHATNFPATIEKINGYPFIVIISIMVTFMLASKPVVQLVRPILEWKVPSSKHAFDR